MNYLLVTHVPFGRGSSDGKLLVGDMWLEDLRAQRRAIAEHGNFQVATPLFDQITREQSGSFHMVEIDPKEEGFEYHPLPPYLSLKSYWQVRGQLRRSLASAARTAAVVQADYGGHPVSLGRVVWPIAGRNGASRIWLFDGADPFPRLNRSVSEETRPLRRVARKAFVRDFEVFCRKAVRRADLVFAHNDAVVGRFQSDWNERCHLFPRSFVTEELLIRDHELEERNQQLLKSADNPLRLIVAGRQIAIKGTDHVLRALAATRSAGTEIELSVLGEGDDLDRFRRLARQLQIDEFVTFRGRVAYGKPLFDAWAQADALVITNLTDEISRNVFLGMARGLPLVMYRNPGTDRLVESSEAGLLVPSGNVEELSRTLLKAAKDRRRLTNAAARGLALVRNHTIDACHRRRAHLAASLRRVA